MALLLLPGKVNQDGNGHGIYAQRYDANGVAVGAEFRINSTTNNSQEYPEITSLAGGGFAATWSSDDQDGSDWGVYTSVFQSGTQLVDGNTIRGGEGDDSIDGGAGYNTYEVEGSPDGFIYQAIGGGQIRLTDLLVDADDPVNGSDQGTDTLTNIHAIRFVSPVDGSSITRWMTTPTSLTRPTNRLVTVRLFRVALTSPAMWTIS